MRYKLGIDTGGTFTDFVLVGEDASWRLVKTPSTPDDPRRAVREGLRALADGTGLDLAELMSRCDLRIHGTTVALNTLIQHKGARVGLLCTKGHEDTLEIRLAHKEDGHRYDFLFPPATMLVPRHLRVPIDERIASDGRVMTPLNEAEVVEAVAYLKAQGVEALAVSLLWSFLNPAHERRIGRIVEEHWPEVYLTLSVDLLPQIREYTRVSTTAVNAYVGPALQRSIAELDAAIGGIGDPHPIRYMQCNGGVASAETLCRKAVFAINSGPAAGPRASQFFGSLAGSEHLLTIDMGGTSTDISITQDGEVDIVKNIDVSRYRLGIPLVNVVSIGAGGGSIAWLDSKHILRVGPQSAEAVPGPACYGRGGSEATVTDALVVLGYLNPRHLLGGAFRIDSAAAHRAVSANVAGPLNLSPEKAALGIHDVVNANMVAGIRAVSVERGYNPRDFVLVAGGGATSAHVARLAADLGIERIIVPKLASGLCAFGEAIADVKHSLLGTYITRFDRLDLSILNALLVRLDEEGRTALRDEGFTDEEMIVKRTLDMRYGDQVHECSVAIPFGGEIRRENLATIEELFHRRHEQLYTYCERDNQAELVNVEVTVLGPSRSAPVHAQAHEATAGLGSPEPVATRAAFFEEAGTFVPTPVFDGERVNAGASMAGPLIIEEPTTTIVVPPGWSIACRRGGFYLLTHLTGAH